MQAVETPLRRSKAKKSVLAEVEGEDDPPLEVQLRAFEVTKLAGEFSTNHNCSLLHPAFSAFPSTEYNINLRLGRYIGSF
jgi:hypothetical protein